MTLGERLIQLRAKAGLSQDTLAEQLGVSRQSVSKWEGGTAMPELVKLISLSELFGVSVDYLVKDWMEEPDNPCGGSGEISSKQAGRLEKKVDELTNYVKGRVYRYDSKTRIFGLPLVSIRFGFVRNGKLSMDNTAKGIIAIGNCAIGVVAIGIVGAMLLTGKTFTFCAIVGALGLVGMMMKNCIVLMDEIGEQIAAGTDPAKALVSSSESRLRPVMMASLTTILGMIPLLGDAMFGSMAATIMGGLLFSTFATLFFVPVLYAMFFKIRIDR